MKAIKGIVYSDSLKILLNPQDDNLVHLEILDGVEVIGQRAFLSSKADYLKIPKSVTRVEKEAFRYSSIREINFKNEVVFGEAAFMNAFNLRSINMNCRRVPINCFVNCTDLRVNLSEIVSVIDFSAFAKASISSINFPVSLEIINDNAFFDTEFKNTNEIKLPKGLKILGKNAFDTYIKNIYLPDTLECIENLLEYSYKNGTIIHMSNILFNKLNLTKQSNLEITSIDELLEKYTFKELNELNKNNDYPDLLI